MNIEIREIPPRRIACVSHRGPYHLIGKAFGELGAWAQEAGAQAGPMLGVYYDHPGATPAEELRSDAGLVVPAEFATDDPRVHVVDLPGGTYAVGTHVGSYEGLPNAWAELTGKWLPLSGCTLAAAPALEVYLDDCAVVPAEQVRTEICLAVQRPAGH